MFRRYYYISYIAGRTNNMRYGSGTFRKRGLPDLERYIKEIRELPENRRRDISVIILSCIKVKKDFIK